MYDRLNPFVRLACEVSSYNIENERRVGLDHRLFFVNRGSAMLEIKGSEYFISEGVLVYIPSYTDYRFSFRDPDEEMSITVINFDFDGERCDIRESIHPIPYSEFDPQKLNTGYTPEGFERQIIVSNARSLGEDMHTLRMLFFNKEVNYRAYASAVLKTLLLKTVSNTHSDRAIDPALGIVTYIKEHYSEKLLAKDIAVLFNYHPNHVNRLVKLSTGRGFKDYLIYYRLKVARDMLVSTADPVTAISQSCGFATPSYFAELFTRQMGMSPREYRATVRATIV